MAIITLVISLLFYIQLDSINHNFKKMALLPLNTIIWLAKRAPVGDKKYPWTPERLVADFCCLLFRYSPRGE